MILHNGKQIQKVYRNGNVISKIMRNGYNLLTSPSIVRYLHYASFDKKSLQTYKPDTSQTIIASGGSNRLINDFTVDSNNFCTRSFTLNASHYVIKMNNITSTFAWQDTIQVNYLASGANQYVYAVTGTSSTVFRRYTNLGVNLDGAGVTVLNHSNGALSLMGIDVDSNNNSYILGTNCIVKLNSSATRVWGVGTPTSTNSRIRVGVDGVFVSDNMKVYKYTFDGVLTETIDIYSLIGGTFADFKVDAIGNIFAVSISKKYVFKVNTSRIIEWLITAPQLPVNIGIDPEGNIYYSQSGTLNIVKVNGAGTFVANLAVTTIANNYISDSLTRGIIAAPAIGAYPSIWQ